MINRLSRIYNSPEAKAAQAKETKIFLSVVVSIIAGAILAGYIASLSA